MSREIPEFLRKEFERGYHPMDEPPGLEEGYFRQWQQEGGKTTAPAGPPAQWAIVELMGHVKLAGRLTEDEKFGGKLGRLDIPDGDGFLTQYFGAASVYRISIVTEAVARHVRKQTAAEPVSAWDFPKQLPPADAPRVAVMEDDDEDPFEELEGDTSRPEP